MFQAIVKVTEHLKKVAEAARKASLDRLRRAAAGIRKDAQASIENAPGPSAPGSPPHSRRGQIRNAIIYDVDADNLSAVIGPRASRVGQSARAHERGGEFKGTEYPARPFMEPAMVGRLESFAGSFSGSIGD